MQHHYKACSDPEFAYTVEMLRENTCVDNLMCTGNNIEELVKSKREASSIRNSRVGTVKNSQWESNIESLESESMQNPRKMLGHVWDTIEDSLLVPISKVGDAVKVSKNIILSQLPRVYGEASPPILGGTLHHHYEAFRIYPRDYFANPCRGKENL